MTPELKNIFDKYANGVMSLDGSKKAISDLKIESFTKEVLDFCVPKFDHIMKNCQPPFGKTSRANYERGMRFMYYYIISGKAKLLNKLKE